jgi:cell volume regulation protein A
MSSTLFADPYVLAGAALLVGALACAALADRVRVPGLLFFLGLGMLVGDDGLDLISLSEPRVVQAAGVVALLVILFEGGLSTKPTDLRRAALPGMALATVGTLITAGVVALGVWYILEVDPTTALLLGAVVASTDAAAVFSLLRSAPLPKRLGSLLEVESGSNDPVAITLTVGILEAWRASPGPLDWLRFGLAQLGGGLLVGAAVGLAGSWLLGRSFLRPGGFHAVLALGVGGLASWLSMWLGSWWGRGCLASAAASSASMPVWPPWPRLACSSCSDCWSFRASCPGWPCPRWP